jgi:putative ABC transport system permease protein
MLLITAVALLSPLLVGPLTRLLTRLPATRLRGAGAMLVRENTATATRRTAAVAAPVLVTVALTGSLLGATATLNEAKTAEIRQRTVADFVVTPATGTGLDPAVVRRLRALPGAEVSVTAASAVHTLEDGVALIRSQARAADPAALAATVRLPLVSGRITDLDDDSIIVNEEWARHTVGERVTVWLGDGTRRSLRIAAVMPTGTGDNGAFLTPANAPDAPVDRVDVTVPKDADAGAVEAELRRAAPPTGARTLTRAEWLRAVSPRTDATTRLGFLLVLGLALLYTGISLANTLVMATADRVREFAALRLAGATHGQLLRLVTAEALTTVTVGTLLGLLVTALNLLGLWTALGLQSVWVPIRLPWTALAVTTVACALLSVVSAIIPTASALRRRAVEAAGARG